MPDLFEAIEKLLWYRKKSRIISDEKKKLHYS
jgi:hypothetical protein